MKKIGKFKLTIAIFLYGWSIMMNMVAFISGDIVMSFISGAFFGIMCIILANMLYAKNL